MEFLLLVHVTIEKQWKTNGNTLVSLLLAHVTIGKPLENNGQTLISYQVTPLTGVETNVKMQHRSLLACCLLESKHVHLLPYLV